MRTINLIGELDGNGYFSGTLLGENKEVFAGISIEEVIFYNGFPFYEDFTVNFVYSEEFAKKAEEHWKNVQ
jgi:hypothetical protein